MNTLVYIIWTSLLPALYIYSYPHIHYSYIHIHVYIYTYIESKLHYQLQKLENILKKQTKTNSKKKLIKDNIHDKIIEIQLSIENTINNTNTYISTLTSINPAEPENFMPEKLAVSDLTVPNNTTTNNNINIPNTDSITNDMYNISKIHYNASEDFIDRGSDLILNYFNKFRQRSYIKGNKENAYHRLVYECMYMCFTYRLNAYYAYCR